MTEDDRYDYDLGESFEVPPNHTVRYLLILMAVIAAAGLAASSVQTAYHDAVIREATWIAGRSAYTMPRPVFEWKASDLLSNHVTCDAGYAVMEFNTGTTGGITITGNTYEPKEVKP